MCYNPLIHPTPQTLPAPVLHKHVQESELRSLKAAAADVAARFDGALTALAAKRTQIAVEVNALECRMLALLLDYETATVTAGPAAEAAAAAAATAAAAALAAAERVRA
jgi:hypothetical protein